MATKTIGPTGDYTTLAAYAAYLDTLNALSAPEIGEVQNTALNVGGSQVVFTGFTPTGTNTWTLRPVTGAGFKDHASAATNALRYNTGNGAAIFGSVGYDYLITISVPFAIVQGLQFRNTASNGGGVSCSADDGVLDGLIVETTGNKDGIQTAGARSLVKNSLAVSDATGSAQGITFVLDGSIINCTVVRPSNRTAGGTGIQCLYNSVLIQNCAVAGFTTPIDKGSATVTGSGNAIDAASYPSGPTGQVSLVIATEFEQPSNASSLMDWRLKSTSVKCKDNGTNSGAPTTDIIGQTISNVIRDAGAWELQQGGGGGTNYNVSATFGLTATLAPTSTAQGKDAGTLGCGADLSGARIRGGSVSALLGAAGALSGVRTGALSVAGALGAGAVLAGVRSAAVGSASVLTAGGALGSAPVGGGTAQSSLSGGAALVGVSSRGGAGIGFLGSSAALAVVGTASGGAALTLGAGAVLSGLRTAATSASGAISAGAGIDGSLGGNLAATSVLASAAITAIGQVGGQISGGFPAIAGLAAAVTAQRTVSVSLGAASDLSFVARVARSAAASMSAGAALIGSSFIGKSASALLGALSQLLGVIGAVIPVRPAPACRTVYAQPQVRVVEAQKQNRTVEAQPQDRTVYAKDCDDDCP